MCPFREHYSDSSVGKVLTRLRGGHLYSTGEAEADDPWGSWASQSNLSERFHLKNL